MVEEKKKQRAESEAKKKEEEKQEAARLRGDLVLVEEDTAIAINIETETREQLLDDYLPAAVAGEDGRNTMYKGGYEARMSRPKESYVYHNRMYRARMTDPNFFDVGAGNIGLATAIAAAIAAPGHSRPSLRSGRSGGRGGVRGRVR